MSYIFKGTGVAMITPFTKSNKIDFDALKNVINNLIENLVDYILIMGTTSEAVCLSENEKKDLLNFSLKEINGRVPVLLGLGGNNTAVVIDTIEKTDFSGIDGILCVSPYYNKPNQKGLYEHFAMIANNCPVEIMIYNVPGRTSVNIAAETTIKLANNFNNITGIKEASGNLDQMMQIINNKPDDFHVISGDDALSLPLISVGGQGVISVLGNAYPKDWSEMIRLALIGNFTEASKIHYKYLNSISLLFAEGNPTGVKAFMSETGIIQNNLRLPLVPASDDLTNKIKKEILKIRNN